jgi:hypothetical protein
MRITKALATECSFCEGLGYTPDTAARMITRRDRDYGIVEVRTVRQGSGCPACLGLGQEKGSSHVKN